MSLLGVRVALLEEAAEKGVELVGTVAGQQVPGLSDLDSSAQILAWAVVFGAAQQLVTGLVDRQADHVLNQVGGKAHSPSG